MRYIPKGVCSQAIDVELDGEIITQVKFTGGCHGNTQGLARLAEGMNARDAINKLRGFLYNFDGFYGNFRRFYLDIILGGCSLISYGNFCVSFFSNSI